MNKGEVDSSNEWQEVKGDKHLKNKQKNKENKQSGKNYKQLQDACFTRNILLVSQLLSKVDINKTDQVGNSALTVAIITRNESLANYLLDEQADINIKNNAGKTPLMLAAYKGYDEMVELLLARGALVDERDAQGSTALMYASSGGALCAVDRLIQYKAGVNLQDYEKRRTPLHWALRMRDGAVKKTGEQHASFTVVAILKLLVNAGANPKIKDGQGLSPISWAENLEWVAELEVLHSGRS